ncbi:MAG: SusC/RagA family TonB-linked outer membrane protein [Tannerella sp.]|jgi:TonB-linked SusC/RagA family outer membrane protein|nr:SusC/RagA family TonB-linked outer membrane protein [Tannerella sp.]
MNKKKIIIRIFICACISTFCVVLFAQEKTLPGAVQSLENEKEDASDEQISLGFFSQPSMAITGAVATVSGSVLDKSPVSDLSQTFAGRLAGLTTIETNSELTNSTVAKIIRGYSTINGVDPLVVIDGVICPNIYYEYLSPKEIESVSILKDASTTAIYGIKGANGVIVITTKRGKVGAPVVDVFYDQSFQQMTKRPQFPGSAKYAELRNQAGVNDGLGSFSQFSQDDINGFRSGSALYPDNDWYNRFVHSIVLMERAGLNVSGGSERVRYFSNINYLHQAMPFKTENESGRKYDPTPDVHELSIRSNLDLQINKYLSGFLLLNGNVKTERTAQYGNSSIYTGIFNLPPVMYGPVTPPNEENPDAGNQVVTHDAEDNPVYGLLNRSGYARAIRTNIIAQTGLVLDLKFLTEGLTLSARLAYQTNSLNNTVTGQNFERYVRSNNLSELIFTKKGTNENTPLVYGKSSQFYYNLNYQANMNYSRRFGRHSVDAMAYILYLQQERESVTGTSMLPYKHESIGMTVLYGYNDTYFLKGDVGYSGSEQFHPDHRYVTTPAISAAWALSKETFLSDVDQLDLLKLRVSYGISANDQLGNDRFLYSDYITSNGFEGLRGNPELSAEKLKKQNYGIDLNIFRGISLSFDYWLQRCDNMLVNSSGFIPSFQGIPLSYYPKLNNGKMKNRGFELTVGYQKQLSKDLSVLAGTSLNINRNKVLLINESPYDESYAYRYRIENYNLGQKWGYLIDYSNGNGMFNSEQELTARNLSYSFGTPRVGDFIYRDLTNDGTVDERDMAPIGYSNLPQQDYRFSGGIIFKGFDLSFLFHGTGRVSTVVSGVGAYENVFQGVFNDIHQNAWTPERYANGEKITYPALSLTQSTNHVENDFFIMNRSYLRLRNLELAYTLPASVSGKIGAGRIRMALNAQNVFTIDRMRTKYIDPEVSAMNTFQPYRVYNIGINLTF